ncbi:MAG: hypothetical protein OES26_24395, partial [Gammaproteobacteria bacterium]|nr:hypothetical protein [Gammaproteobacteria bacterium]
MKIELTAFANSEDMRTLIAAFCAAVLLGASLTGCSVEEPEDGGSSDSTTGHVPVDNAADSRDEAVAPAELELRRGVMLFATDGQDFRAIGLTETITDPSTGLFSKTVQVGDRVATIVGDEETAFLGSDDRAHWIRFDRIRLNSPTLSAVPVDAFIDTLNTPADP